jgi:hypothetical protein
MSSLKEEIHKAKRATIEVDGKRVPVTPPADREARRQIAEAVRQAVERTAEA